ncbi:MAG: HIT family hydrolase [Desulfotalea sp.]|nr:MAG: HIT family hydrolase [Desulfotalea sp.]
MKTLWTPWRIDHVLGKAKKVAHCIFEPPGHEPSSKDDLLLHRDKRGIVLLNRFPYANGHLLIAPVRHTGCITELTITEHCDLMFLIQQSTKILKKHLHPDGFNIGCNLGKIAGAGIADHLHFHIVPRWDGDHNFITVVSEIRTIPEHIDNTFDNLLPDFTSLYLEKNHE